MKNEMIVYESIEKEISKVRKENVFPLTPTHRKELRELKSTNIGNLHRQLDTIKILKEEEFYKIHKKRHVDELKSKIDDVEKLNREWVVFIEYIKNFIKRRKNQERKTLNFEGYQTKVDWNDISNLNSDDIDLHRRIEIDLDKCSNTNCNVEFDELYSKSFDQVKKQIDKIETMYEEAINFGDLEMVKKLYYIMNEAGYWGLGGCMKQPPWRS